MTRREPKPSHHELYLFQVGTSLTVTTESQDRTITLWDVPKEYFATWPEWRIRAVVTALLGEIVQNSSDGAVFVDGDAWAGTGRPGTDFEAARVLWNAGSRDRKARTP